MFRLDFRTTMAAISVALLILFCSLSRAVSAAVKDSRVHSVAPDFSLLDVNGAKVKLSDFRGEVVLLNFWAASCKPCNIEIPWFNEFVKSYGERGFTVLAIAMDQGGSSVVKPYIEKNNIRYKVLLGNEVVAKAYGGVEALPTTFLIDREGKIAARLIGIAGRVIFEADIRKLLDQQ
jgi:peroxiredoxin